MRKSLLVIILAVFILTSAPAMAGGGKTDSKTIGSLNFTDKVVYFLDHTSDSDEGNWITLGCPDEDRCIQLPEPIKLTYNGTKYKEFGGVSGTLNKEEDESYTIKYPSNASYSMHPVYLPTDKVTMSFHGNSSLKDQNVEIYLFRLTSNCAHELLDVFLKGDIRSLDTLFKDSVGEEYKKDSVTLNTCGDISNHDLGRLNAGEYCIVMVKKNNDESMTVLSSTAFVVTEYKLNVNSPDNIVKGSELDISMKLEDASDTSRCTYGAVLIKEQAYKANIEINSDGTKAGTSVIINDLDIIDEFDINSSNYRSKLSKNELQTEIQTLIGEGNGAIAIGEAGQNRLSLTAFELPVGNYYLIVGAYIPGKGLVGLSQTEVEIKSKGDSNSNNNNNGSGGKGGSSGGAGGSPEPAKNVKVKELCQQFVTNGNKIKFEFTKKATSISYLEFDAKKTAGKVTATVEELKGKSSLTPAEPEGIVYKHLNIWVGNSGFANSKNIENSIVGFRVSKEWIDENHINADTIVLQHFDGAQWDNLKTGKIDEDNEYLYFEAETPGFSPFAITASKNIIEIGEKSNSNGGQTASEIRQQDNSELAIGSDMSSKEERSSWSRITSFFIGFLVIILIGTTVLRIVDQKNDDMDSKK